MAANAAIFQIRPERAAGRILRPVILLLVLALHAALVSLAMQWQTHIALLKEQPLIFLSLPGRAPAAAETPTAPEPVREKPAPSRATQLIIIPEEEPPAPVPLEKPVPRIDWNAEAALTAMHQAQASAEPGPRPLDRDGSDLYIIGGGLGPDAAYKPEFGWYHARTHRVEAMEGGGSILWINDRCFVVMAGLIPFPMCGVGKIPVRGDLFNGMHDSLQDTAGQAPRANTAP
jgi:hypothetical protein